MNSDLHFPSDIEFLRILWCDNANIVRAKALYNPSIENNKCSVGISEAQQAISTTGSVVKESGLSPVGEVQLRADPNSFTILPYAPGQGQVMGDMLKDGKAWKYCPRGFIRKMIKKAAQKGFQLKAAFENEFYLLKKDENDLKPSDNTPFASSHAMDVNGEIINQIIEVLVRQGMQVQQYYPESGPGQQEITIKYADALKACDNQIAYRETVKAVAIENGFIASFLPKIFPNNTGSGCHLHMSLWKGDENIFSDANHNYGFSKMGEQFIAGVLHHLPALMAVTNPIPNSYRRIEPHAWTGAYQCWGMDNREAAIRVVKEFDGLVKNFELKTLDASSNPYLALGTVIAAGIHGLEEEMSLPQSVQEDPAYINQDLMEKHGIKRLPSDLRQALSKLKKDETILSALGDELSTAYIAVKEADIKEMGALTLQEEVDLLLETY